MDDRSILLPRGNESARLIVCEGSGRWAVAMRRESGELGLPICETRNFDECWRMLDEAPASFVIIEVSAADLAESLRRIGRLAREFPLARAAGVADRSLGELEWPLREAGAVHFVCSPRQLGPLVPLVRRHIQRAPDPPSTVVQRIRAGLPWKKHAKPLTT